MSGRYSIAEARDRLSSLVHEAEAGDPVVLTRHGDPVAVIVSMETYRSIEPRRPTFWDQLQRIRREHAFESLGIQPEEVFGGVEDRGPGREFSW